MIWNTGQVLWSVSTKQNKLFDGDYLFMIITFAGHNADDIAETVIMNGEPL